eukprot:TRINITY_DN32869_c0_g1_i1.p1 TRINITY_DN32869_c0_g1~~TRINITY_DN32869_c0_g1_i1.p1  ORF type:complete len:304 (+),score=47.44 TRINITY_DN32869_c0_g1_i1:64-975(+)
MAGQMSVKELKAALDALSISYHGIFEKSELAGLLEGAWNPKPVAEEAPEEKFFDLPVNNLAGNVVATVEVCGGTGLHELQCKLAPNVEDASAEEIIYGVGMYLGDSILDPTQTQTLKEANVKQGDVLTVVFGGILKEIMLARQNGPYILRQGKIEHKSRPTDEALTVLRFPQGIAYQRPVQKYHVTYSCHEHGEIATGDTVMQFSEGVVSSNITDMDKTCDVVWKKSVAYSESIGWRTGPHIYRGGTALPITEKPWAAESVTPVNENFRLWYFSREDEDFWKNDGPALEAFKQLESIPDDGTA